MQARLPGAIAAERNGDPAALLRLRRIAEGPPTKSTDLSFALNVTTSCLDAAPAVAGRLGPERAPRARGRRAGRAPARRPTRRGRRETVRSSSYADDCLLFPRQAAPLPALLPLPDVPALVLARPPRHAHARRERARHGRAACRARRWSRCRATATTSSTRDGTELRDERAAALHRPQAACRPLRQAPRPNSRRCCPIPPRSIEDFRHPAAIAGDRGRTLFAVMDSVVRRARSARWRPSTPGGRPAAAACAAALQRRRRLRRHD